MLFARELLYIRTFKSSYFIIIFKIELFSLSSVASCVHLFNYSIYSRKIKGVRLEVNNFEEAVCIKLYKTISKAIFEH